MKDAVLLALIIVGWGCWALFEKLAVRSMSPMLVLLTSTYVYSALAPIIWLGMRSARINFDWSPWGIFWTTCASLAATLASFAWLYAARERPVVDMLGWTQTYPILTLALCWAFLQEAVTWTKFVGIVLIIAGTWTMQR